MDTLGVIGLITGLLSVPASILAIWQIWRIWHPGYPDDAPTGKNRKTDAPSYDLRDAFVVETDIKTPGQMSNEERHQARVYYLRERLKEAAKHNDLPTLKEKTAELRKLNSALPDLLYYDALIAFHNYLLGYSYRGRSEQERVERDRDSSFDVGIQTIESYTRAVPYDANGWLLRAEMEGARQKLGWSKRCFQCLAKGIEADPERLDLRFYRGEIVARAFPTSQLSDDVIVEAIRDLSAYLRENPEHARGYRLLSGLYAEWKPNGNDKRTREASVLCSRLADLADGRWRSWYRGTAAWGLLVACIVAMISVILLPRLGMTGLAALLGIPSYLVGMYSFFVLVRSIPSGTSGASIFVIDCRDNYHYESEGWMDHILLPRPSATTTRAKLDEIERGLGIMN
jgi:hypothetical protein